MLKKAASSNSGEVIDVRADDPEHAMEHFNEGLRRVLAAGRPPKKNQQQRLKRKRLKR